MKPSTSAALQRLKEARKQAAAGSSTRHTAATSDADNEAYMREFETAFQQLSAAPSTSTAAQGGQLSHTAACEQPLRKPAVPSTHRAAASAPSTTNPGSHVIQAARGRAEAGIGGSATTPIAPGWRTGPVVQAGRQRQATHTMSQLYCCQQLQVLCKHSTAQLHMPLGCRPYEGTTHALAV